MAYNFRGLRSNVFSLRNFYKSEINYVLSMISEVRATDTNVRWQTLPCSRIGYAWLVIRHRISVVPGLV